MRSEFDDELELEAIRSHKGKKQNMSLLNQKNVSKWEMDELFAEENSLEEF